MRDALTAAQVRELFDYDPATGWLVWRRDAARNVFAGSRAGCKTSRGRVTVGIGGRVYFAHRLVWLHQYGEWPAGQIDHVNRDPGDNRLANLRLATSEQNNWNRAFKGVWRTREGNWAASVTHQGKRLYLGRFPSEAEAIAAYQARASRLRGEFMAA